MGRKKITVLGATGSIGENTLNVLRGAIDDFEIIALSAHTNTKLLLQFTEEFHPRFVAVTGQTDQKAFEQALPAGVLAGFGEKSMVEACKGADMVVLAVVGIAGLKPFVYCMQKGIPVALANKEAMIYGGRLMRNLMDETKTPVVPIDSELSAIFQCLHGNEKDDISRILLTASGGPFRTASIETMRNASVEQALAHPNWRMGAKTTVDCATMMNKGLEVMEVRWMFDIEPSKIEVLVHTESIVHSMVEFCDHSILAQLSVSDMKLPIAYALSYPTRHNTPVAPLDLTKVGALHFEKPDIEKFHCLRLAYEAIAHGGELQIVLNSANEVAVASFLERKIPFYGIWGLVEDAMHKFYTPRVNGFDDIFALDKEVRSYVGAKT